MIRTQFLKYSASIALSNTFEEYYVHLLIVNENGNITTDEIMLNGKGFLYHREIYE